MPVVSGRIEAYRHILHPFTGPRVDDAALDFA